MAPKIGAFFMEKIEQNLISFKLTSLLAILFIVVFGIYLNSISSVTGIIWIFSVIAGITLQKSRLCFASSFRDLFLFGSTPAVLEVLVEFELPHSCFPVPPLSGET